MNDTWALITIIVTINKVSFMVNIINTPGKWFYFTTEIQFMQ